MPSHPDRVRRNYIDISIITNDKVDVDKIYIWPIAKENETYEEYLKRVVILTDIKMK